MIHLQTVTKKARNKQTEKIIIVITVILLLVLTLFHNAQHIYILNLPIDDPSHKHNWKVVVYPTKSNNQLSNTDYKSEDNHTNSDTIQSVKEEAADYRNKHVWPRVDRFKDAEPGIINLHNLYTCIIKSRLRRIRNSYIFKYCAYVVQWWRYSN